MARGNKCPSREKDNSLTCVSACLGEGRQGNTAERWKGVLRSAVIVCSQSVNLFLPSFHIIFPEVDR